MSIPPLNSVKRAIRIDTLVISDEIFIRDMKQMIDLEFHPPSISLSPNSDDQHP